MVSYFARCSQFKFGIFQKEIHGEEEEFDTRMIGLHKCKCIPWDGEEMADEIYTCPYLS